MTLNKGSLSKLSVISAFAVLLTALTGIFGTPFLRVIRNVYGSLTFWVLLFLFLLGSTFFRADWFSYIAGSVWITTGISLELEKRKFSFLWNSILSLTVGFTICTLGLIDVLRKLGITDVVRATEYFKETIKPMIKAQENQEVDYSTLVLQTPSVLFITLLLGLAFGYLMERRVRFWFRLSKQAYVYKFDFLKFRVSDRLIWVALFALLFSTLGSMNANLNWIGTVSANVVNVFLVVYFFQGLAILENFLIRIKAGIFFRTLNYFIFIGQLFLVLSIVGFLDFWFDFRARMFNRRLTKT